MDNLAVLIVDDEPIAQNIIELYCQKLPNISVVAKCSNAIDAAHILQQHPVDVLFLDINMPELSGIDFVRSLQRRPEIVFTTAYSEYAVLSYELNALDYLVKPISFERFFIAINKAIQLKLSAQEKVKSIDTESPDQKNVLFVRSEGKFIRIDLNELLYIEGLKDYVKFCFADKKIVVHGTLKRIEEYLSTKQPPFLRIHKSYIINTEKIKEFSSDLITLTINNISIPLGQTYAKDLEKKISGKKY